MNASPRRFAPLALATLLAIAAGWLHAPRAAFGQLDAHAAVTASATPTVRVSESEAPSLWPSSEQWRRVLTLRDHNTRVVLAGTTLLGICSGVVGVFMLLRRRSLVGDVVSHSALPGVAGAFLAIEIASPGAEKSLPALLAGAFVAGVLGVLATTAIRRLSRIKEDAALAITLSIFFGLGVVLITVAQQTPTGNAAGLQHFIYGKAAAMVESDVRIIGTAAFVVLAVCALLFKEFAVLCFDPEYAAAQGWPTTALDLLLMTLVTATTVVGMQSVGLLLVTALLITPAASARFWTDRLESTAFAAAAFGGASALLGAATSALFPKLAAGATIVLAGSLGFLISFLFGARRGVVLRLLARRRLEATLRRRSLLARLYETLEESADESSLAGDPFARPLSLDAIAAVHHRPSREIAPAVAELTRRGLLRRDAEGSFAFTPAGLAEAERAVLHDRLWEAYLRLDPEVARSRVDRDAEDPADLLEPELIATLRARVAESRPRFASRVFATADERSAARVL